MRKIFEDYLYEEKNGGLRVSIIKGSEHLPRYPTSLKLGHLTGIVAFSTRKIGEETCLRVDRDNVDQVQTIGWRLVSLIGDFAYIVREDVSRGNGE